MNDIISRRAALDCFHDWIDKHGNVYCADESEEYQRIEALPSASQWIPCSERLPETEDKVLCCTATKKGVKSIVIGYYMADMKYWACGMNNNVIAWMPLPEVYKGETDG